MSFFTHKHIPDAKVRLAADRWSSPRESLRVWSCEAWWKSSTTRKHSSTPWMPLAWR